MSRGVRFANLLVLLSVAVAAGCSGISYNSDFDPAIDFGRFQTYAWVEDLDASAVKSRGLDPLDEKRVVTAVENELAGKGMQKSSSNPDFVVNFYITTQEKIDVSTYHAGWGYYGWYGGTQTSVRQWTEGTLVVDFIDLAEKDLAWRGWATGAIDRNQTAEQKTKAVNDVVAGIMKQFPPKT